MPFIKKTIKKAFIKRSRCRNIYLKNRSDNNKREYNKQRNYCVSLLRKTKTSYYANLNEKDFTDSKQFWRTVKPLLSDKIKSSEKITLVEQRENLDTDGNIDNKIVNDDIKIAEIFNRFFSNAVIDLKISDFHGAVPLADNISHPIFTAILKYANHPSTIAIKDLNHTLLFSFSNVSAADVKKEIRKLDPRKATENTDIPVRILKQNSDIFGNYICDFFNECVDKGVFPSILKNANITPIFKKDFRGSKDNYRPVSVLPIISKIFEKLLSKQIIIYIDKFLSKYQCGFRKGYNVQHCLLAMIEKWKKAVDNGNVFGALLMDLSKAFDCLQHDLIIAKLNLYGFNLTALNLIHNYLTKRKQRIKINHLYSSWGDILFGVPQGSLLGPIICNIFLSDLFLIVDDIDIANYADDNTIYKEHKNIDDLLTSLQNAAAKLFKWFSDNQMWGNTDKCHLLLSKYESSEIHIGDSIIESSTCEKLLGIKIDSKLRFDDHIQDLCNKANRK